MNGCRERKWDAHSANARKQEPAPLLLFEHHGAFFVKENRAFELSEIIGLARRNLYLLNDIFALIVEHVAFG